MTLFLGLTLVLSAQNIADLRAEMAKIQAQRSRQRVEQRAEIEGLVHSLESLKAQTRNAQFRIREQEAQIQRLHQITRNETEVLADLVRFRRHIEMAIPFKKAVRIEQLDVLRVAYAEGALEDLEVYATLTRWLEEEALWAKTSQLSQSQIELDGQTVLATVVRLGMGAMLFKSGETYGFAKATKGGYEMVACQSNDDREAVVQTIAFFEQGRSSGWVRLPALLSEVQP